MAKKLSFKNIRKPRPLWLKVIGETFQGISTTTAVTMVGIVKDIEQYRWYIVTIMVIGLLGNAFTHLFAAIDQAYYQEEVEITRTKTRVTKIEDDADDNATDANDLGVIN